MCSEPSRRHMYLLGTEDISETNPVLYNLHIVEGYDLAGAIREYSELYNLDDHYENPVLIREVEQWRNAGPISGFGVRPRPDKTKPEQDESHEEATMKEETVKGNRTKEKEPLDVIDFIPQFGITSELNNDIPYYLEFNRDDHIERVMLVMTDIDKDHISYQYWDTDDNVIKSDRLTPEDFRDSAYTLFTYSGRIFNDVIEYVSQFDITSGIELHRPYILELITTDDNFERRVIIITDIGKEHIDYKYWTEDEDGVSCSKCSTLLPHFFQKGTCKLYKLTAEDLK